MNRLWVYGCSFSEPFGLLPMSDKSTILENGLRDFLGTDYWGTILARKMGLICVSKGLSGIGWNYISFRIDQDVIEWDKNDVIIVSPSFLSRVNIMEFENGDTREELIQYYKSWPDITAYNELRWRTKIKTLQKFGFNVYTWVVDKEAKCTNDIKNLIMAPGGLINWKDWMDLHKEYWTDPTPNKYPDGDWHFNELGHKAVAEIMYNSITRSNENSNKTVGKRRMA